MQGRDSDMHLVHVRLTTADSRAVHELQGYVTFSQRRGLTHGHFHCFQLLDDDGPIWNLYPDGTAKMRGHLNMAPRYWCQVYPWEARQAALAMLALGDCGAMHKDVARMFARAIYCTRHRAKWRRPDTYHLG